MKRHLIPLLAALLTLLSSASCSDNFTDNYPVVFAHRGCWLADTQISSDVTEYYVPENSLDGIRMAARMGYPTIELDVRWTLDSVLVCMHDGTINRTMRNAADQSPIEEPVAVSTTSFEDLRTKYALWSVDPEMRRPIPTLEEILRECAACGIRPIMHCNIYEGYELAVPILGKDFIGFSSNHDVCLRTRAITDNLILFDVGEELKRRGLEETPANVKDLLDEIGTNMGTSSMGMGITTPEMVKALHEAGHPIQSSIYPSPKEVIAVRNGADILLSDFCWRPTKEMKPASRVKMHSKGDEAYASFEECELGALTLTLKGHGNCTVTIEEKAYNGTSETRTYEFEDAGTERLSFRFWKTANKVTLVAAPGSDFQLTATLYEL